MRLYLPFLKSDTMMSASDDYNDCIYTYARSNSETLVYNTKTDKLNIYKYILPPEEGKSFCISDKKKKEGDAFLRIFIFGARSIALGIYKAIKILYSNITIEGFIVTEKAGNLDTLAGLPVFELRGNSDKNACILIATPEDMQKNIIDTLDSHGFHNHICIDSTEETHLMESYYEITGEFKLLKFLSPRK